MTDIVERLRDGRTSGAFVIRLDAADEIERLRLLQENSKHWEAQHLAEIERLRAALQGITEATDLDEVSVIARRALEPKP